MKFLHLGDLHLGRQIGDFKLEDDQRYMIGQLLDIAVEQSVDGIIIAGDVYDRANPAEWAVTLLDEFFRGACEKSIPLYIIAGNHDSCERLKFGSSLFASEGIHIAAAYEGELWKCSLKDTYGDLNLYMMPFVKASGVRHFHPDAEIADYEAAVREIIRRAEVDNNCRNVLVAHQFVAGTSTGPILGGSESPAVQHVGLVERIGYDVFDDFDYVALGHIHSAQSIGRDAVRYAGSPLKYSLSEAEGDKEMTLVEIGRKGEVSITSIPIVPLRDLRHVRGRLSVLLSDENVTDPQDYIYATLTDEDTIDNAMAIFQEVYPRTVRIDYDNSHTKEVYAGDLVTAGEDKPFMEVFADFYESMYGCEMEEDERKLILEIAKEEGIVYEAD